MHFYLYVRQHLLKYFLTGERVFPSKPTVEAFVKEKFIKENIPGKDLTFVLCVIMGFTKHLILINIKNLVKVNYWKFFMTV